MKRKLRIVFLDAGTLDYGDVDLRPLGRFGTFRIHHHTAPDAVERRSRGADIVVTNKCMFDAGRLARLKSLKLICLAATGTNNIDLDAARRCGIAVTNVAGYSTENVVQCTFAFILAHAMSLVPFNAVVRRRWSRSPFFMLASFPVREVAGKTLGVVGYGHIGRRVAQVARAFGMKVLVARMPGRTYTAAQAKGRAPLTGLLRRSDFVSLHAPLVPQTRNLINARTLKYMKKTAVLINVARGPLVDERALAAALKSGRIAGAASDVLAQEPPPVRHPLFDAPNMLLTPHVAWASIEARTRLTREMELNIEAFLKGRRRNRVA